MDRKIRRPTAIMIAAVSLSSTALHCAEITLKTWHPWQLDSVLVAWVLAQARTQAPLFESVPRGNAIPAVEAIDTPDSPYRRGGQWTAFEEATRIERFQHVCVPRLREAVRVVELASWRKPEYPKIEEFEARIVRSLPAHPAKGGLDAAFAEVDQFCRETKP